MRERRTKRLSSPVAFRELGLDKSQRGTGIAAGQRFPAASPNAVTHVGVGGVRNAGFAQVANVVQVFFDLLVAPGKIQRHLRHVMETAARAHAASDVVDLEAAGLPLLAHLDEALGGGGRGRGARGLPRSPQAA